MTSSHTAPLSSGSASSPTTLKRIPFARSRTLSVDPTSPISGSLPTLGGPYIPQTIVPLEEFKLNDYHPRKQRTIISALKQQQTAMLEAGAVCDPRERRDTNKGTLTHGKRTFRSNVEDAPKIRSKDLDLPFKRASTFSMSKFNPLASKPKARHSPEVSMHLLVLAIRDQREEEAQSIIADLAASVMKKKFPYEANTAFLLAMANRMEKVACMLLDRGFPGDVNAPIYTMKPSKKYGNRIPFRMNATILPSYFLVAVALNFETLVRFMIKMGANLNQAWFGLTPLHVALYCYDGRPNMNLVMTLLDYGADPWTGLLMEQLHLLLKLKNSYMNDENPPSVAPRRRLVSTNGKIVPRPNDAYIILPLISLPQRQLYRRASILEIPRKSTRGSASSLRSVPEGEALNKPQSLQSIAKAATVFAPKDALPPSKEEINKRIEGWRRSKYVFPVTIAASSGNRAAVLAILQKMSTARSRKPIASFAAGVPVNFLSRSFNSVGTLDTADKPFNQKIDTLSLLVQQDLETTIYLLKSNATDIMQRDPKGANALHLAARAGNIEMVHVLLHFDDSEATLLNSRGENGWTALHEAISLKRLEIFRLLIKKGAEIDITNDQGDSPRDVGGKVGIDASDLGGIWFVKRGSANAFHQDSATTAMPGSSSTELLFNLDSNLLRLLASLEPHTKNTVNSSSRTVATGALSRTYTYDGVTSPSSASMTNVLGVESEGDVKKMNAGSLHALGASNNGGGTAGKGGIIGGIKIPFSKMLFASKSKRKENMVSHIDTAKGTMETPATIVVTTPSPTPDPLGFVMPLVSTPTTPTTRNGTDAPVDAPVTAPI